MSGFNQYGAIFLHRIQRTVKILPLRARLQFLAAITDLLKICKTKFTPPLLGGGPSLLTMPYHPVLQD